MHNQSRKHRWLRWLIGVAATLLIMIFAAGGYFFHVAMVPGHKDFINNNTKIVKSDPLYQQKKWYQDVHKTRWTIKSATGNYRLDAWYVPAAKKTNKSVLIAHGFMGNKDQMGAYAALFHQLGYNVLVPDARAQGQSEGKYIGYGWPERYDERKWINKLIKHNGQDSQIVMFGVSMGGATTMMTSGIQLPRQVKAFVEDCGYSSLAAEIDYEAQNLYHLPWLVRKPLEGSLSIINRIANGFYLHDASSTAMLKQNHRPMLFIHGADDDFVPTRMVYQNYQATRGPKQLWVVKGAAHAKSFATNSKAYQKHVQKFLDQYVK